MPWSEIYKYEDLHAITHSGIITESLLRRSRRKPKFGKIFKRYL